MIDALAPMYIDQFAEYKEVLVLKDDPRPALSGQDFLQKDNIIALIYQFKPQHRDENLQALTSIWTKYYFVRLIPPVAAANLVLNRNLPLTFDHIEIVIDDKGLPCAFKLKNDGHNFNNPPNTPFERFNNLIDGNLTPFINAVHAATKVSKNVLWSNAGNYFEWIISAMEGIQLPSQLTSDGRKLFDLRHDESALQTHKRRNPLWQPIRYVQTQEINKHRERRVCCIRYLLSDMELCNNCPRLRLESPANKIA